MTNIFLFDYTYRLQSWSTLKNNLRTQTLEKICVEVDNFWQKAPIQNHYLHPDFIKDWPTPWELLLENVFCNYAKGLGMIYTLLLLDTKNIEFVEAKDDNSNEVVLVLVDDAKYVLNYWPGTVLNNDIAAFKITRTIDITPLYKKIGL